MLTTLNWGLLAPYRSGSLRRSRSLGLGAAVRAFNDLAVPGIGGVWFAKILSLACLGISVARSKGLPTIPVTNAIEALACFLELHRNEWFPDPRLRGATKLRSRKEWSFAKVRSSSFYVTQPMRQQTVQPLLALGLVVGGSRRFSAYDLTTEGEELIELSFSKFRPHRWSVGSILEAWIDGTNPSLETGTMREALSPARPLPAPARERIRELLIRGSGDGAARRRSALAWVGGLSPAARLGWGERPPEITPEHWEDLRAGARFFEAQDRALAVLDEIEATIGPSAEREISVAGPFPDAVDAGLTEWERSCRSFLDEGLDPTPGRLATIFCREGIGAAPSNRVRDLVARDGRGLRLDGNRIIPGPAYRPPVTDAGEEDEVRGNDGEASEEPTDAIEVAWPRYVSYRVKNLYRLHLDLEDRLDELLPAPGGATE